MNKTIFLAILFILTLILAIVTVNTEYKFEFKQPMSNSVSPSQSNFNKYVDFGEISVAPLGEFCSEKGMEMWTGRTINDTGCKDDSGNIYKYSILYNDGDWIIGDKTYKAVWR